jgi:hypothetical protein
MAADGSFLVEDFVGAIASQLDRTQDALALKAVNRPLTYAIKDFTMELKVFVEMDPEGKVRFRSPGANEPGASSVHIGFTTITRPMIQENTVEVALTRSPTLGEAGLSERERRRLEQLGVRTTAELKRLGTTTGAAGISRLADIPVDRLRAALTYGRPEVRDVRPAPPQTRPSAEPPRAGVPPPPALPRPGPIRVPPGTKRLELVGRNMLGGAGTPPELRLDGRTLTVEEADDGRVVARLPETQAAVGTLEFDHGDGDVVTYELASGDPWEPEGG